jgi:hypothetical protein
MKALSALPLWLAISLWLAASPSAAAGQQTPRHLWLGEAARDGELLVVPLEMDDFSGVVAGDLDLVFDSAQVRVAAVRPGALLEGFSLFSNTIDDTLKISFAGFQPGTGSGTLLEIAVETEGTAPRFAFAAIVLSAADGATIPVEYEVPTAVEQEIRAPGEAGLRLSFPNPFNGQTTLSFSLAAPGPASLAIYNLAGQVVRVLVEEMLPAGEHRVVWDGRNEAGQEVGSGVYMYRLQAGAFSQFKGMAMVR